jgi:steroid delta-isomerase-like uncharacterized protein
MSTPSGNKAAARRFMDECWNGANYRLMPELVAPGYVSHDDATPLSVSGIDGYEQLMRTYRGGFPDMHFTIDELIGEGDLVAIRWTASGTQTGALWGLPPTGKRSVVSGCTMTRFAGGKMQESWVAWDSLSMMRQLGFVPQPGAALATQQPQMARV